MTKGTITVQPDDTIQKAQVRKSEADIAQARAHLEMFLGRIRQEQGEISRKLTGYHVGSHP